MNEANKIFDKLFENASCSCSLGGYSEPSFQCESCWIISYEGGLREEIQSLKKLIVEARAHIEKADEWDGEYFAVWEDELKEWLDEAKDIRADK